MHIVPVNIAFSLTLNHILYVSIFQLSENSSILQTISLKIPATELQCMWKVRVIAEPHWYMFGVGTNIVVSNHLTSLEPNDTCKETLLQIIYCF